jgi:hypothetical protein
MWEDAVWPQGPGVRELCDVGSRHPVPKKCYRKHGTRGCRIEARKRPHVAPLIIWQRFSLLQERLSGTFFSSL